MVYASHFNRLDSFYRLHLPAGNHQLLVVSDLNRDGKYDEHEVVGTKTLNLDPAILTEKILADFDIDLGISGEQPLPFAGFHLEVKKPAVLAQSIFFPQGNDTIP